MLGACQAQVASGMLAWHKQARHNEGRMVICAQHACQEVRVVPHF